MTLYSISLFHCPHFGLSAHGRYFPSNMVVATKAGIARPEPIAVIGLGMRFPGDAQSSDSFWDLLRRGCSTHGPVPKHRFDLDGFYHPNGARAGSVRLHHPLSSSGGSWRNRSTSKGLTFSKENTKRQQKSLTPLSSIWRPQK